MKTTRKPSWKPIRRGRLYCSPACGGGCTYGEYMSAVQEADELRERLGPSWETRVWENLGWHFGAHLEAGGWCISVYPSSHGKFHCMIGTGRGMGSPGWYNPTFRSRNPRAVVGASLDVFFAEAEAIRISVEAFRKAVK